MSNDILKVGMLMRVTRGDLERHNAKWFQTGDIVEITDIYDHIILCKKLKRGKDGWRMKQCYPRNFWWANLEVYKAC